VRHEARDTRAAEAPGGTDRELAALVLEGDERAFRALYRRHTPRLWVLLRRMLGGPGSGPDAEDALQETWIRAVGGLAAFRWEAAFSTWLTGIGLNCAREALRRRGRLERTATEPVLDRPDGGGRPDPEGRMDLEGAIAALPDGYRAVLVLHDVEGFTHREIGHRLDISEGTSKSQLHHARKAVRAFLAPEPREGADAVRKR
jgi:RNA polymerase sigma-70 factor (ECF subfamily)